MRRISGCTELTPLGKSGGAVQLEIVSAVEVALVVEVIMDRGVNGGKFLQASHAPKTLHRLFSSSQWQMRVLGPVVQPAAGRLEFYRSQLSQRCPI